MEKGLVAHAVPLVATTPNVKIMKSIMANLPEKE